MVEGGYPGFLGPTQNLVCGYYCILSFGKHQIFRPEFEHRVEGRERRRRRTTTTTTKQQKKTHKWEYTAWHYLVGGLCFCFVCIFSFLPTTQVPTAPMIKANNCAAPGDGNFDSYFFSEREREGRQAFLASHSGSAIIYFSANLLSLVPFPLFGVGNMVKCRDKTFSLILRKYSVHVPKLAFGLPHGEGVRRPAKHNAAEPPCGYQDAARWQGGESGFTARLLHPISV